MNSGVDFLIEEVKSNEWQDKFIWHKQEVFDKAKAMHKEEVDNKVIHFAEWLTKKHTLELMTLYSQFQEQNYKKSTDSE